MPTLSYHAQTRLQQRGIPASILDNLLDYGCQTYDHQGARIVYFDHRAKKRLMQRLGTDAYKRMEAHLDTYAVLSLADEVVTVGHRSRRIPRH